MVTKRLSYSVGKVPLSLFRVSSVVLTGDAVIENQTGSYNSTCFQPEGSCVLSCTATTDHDNS